MPSWLDSFLDQVTTHIEIKGAGEIEMHYEVPAPDDDPAEEGADPEINYRHFLTLSPARAEPGAEHGVGGPVATPVDYVDIARIMNAFETTLEVGVDFAASGAGVVTIGGYLLESEMREPVLLEIHVHPLSDSEVRAIQSPG